MPRIYDIYLESIVYIYPSEQDAINGERVGGCGFLYGIPSDVVEDSYHVYVVTNRHVAIRPENPNPAIRINTKTGKFESISTNRDNWKPHPDGDDLAILPIGIKPNIYKYNFLRSDQHPISDEFIKSHDIGPGDEVFMTGRFINHEGKDRNIPAVCFGNISMMPEEPILNEWTQLRQESYLVEMRSISGYSGSPVIVYLSSLDLRPKQDKIDLNNIWWEARLLGINWGHLPIEEQVVERDGSKNNDGLKIKFNSNMACVVPVSKMTELLNIDELSRKRQEDNLKELERRKNVKAVPD